MRLRRGGHRVGRREGGKGDDATWALVSPAAGFQAGGGRTGAYILAGGELALDELGGSVISYADHAIAMVDEIESGDHVRQRISVVRR